jgi:hypothetical protein
MEKVVFKAGKSNGFNRYHAVVNGVEVRIINYNTGADHSLLYPFEVNMAGLPYKYGGYCYRTLKEAKEAAAKLSLNYGK